MDSPKQRLKGSVESFSSHIDPNNEGQLKLSKIENESKVEQILQLAESINKGNNDGNLVKRSQIIDLINDFHKQYESLYALYDNLRGKIRQKLYIGDDINGSPTSSHNSDSDLYYSPRDDNSIDETNKKLEASHFEEYILNDRLTSTSEVLELSKDHQVETKYSDKMVEKLPVESSWLKEKISKQEEELLSVSKKHQLQESERLAKIQELENQHVDLKQELERVKRAGVSEVTNMKNDLETLDIEKNKLKNQLESEKKKSSQSLNELEKRNLELDKIEEQEIQLVDLKQELERVNKAGAFEVTNLKKDLKTMEMENHKLQKQLESEKKKSVKSLNQMEKRNLALMKKVAQHKIDEMAEEFNKHFEDKLHTLSRRIEAAEQLQVDLSEWYTATIQTYAQENNVKEMISTTNNMIGSLDVVGQRFEERTVDFMNRISNISCELKFAQDWVMRKNKETLHVEAQLHEKEAEILAFGKRVRESENEARELGKLMKENEECMLVLKEEKIEAIRQLCILTDYHRSRSDYYKKTLTDISGGYKRSA